MPISATRTIGGGLAAMGVVAAARRARALSRSGAVAAWGVGTIAVAGGGWAAGGALVAFLASSSALSHLGRSRLPISQKRGSERDAVQVAANGGFASLAALSMATSAPANTARDVFYGSLAAATADTWATECGRWSAQAPRRLLLGPSVPPGTSGGMTPIGTAGSAAGAIAIAAIGALDPARSRSEQRRAFGAVVAAGIAGACVDSLLGATVQEVRVCPACGRETELSSHCGVATIHANGWTWLDNDAVNAAATAVGGLVGWGLVQFLRRRPAKPARAS